MSGQNVSFFTVVSLINFADIIITRANSNAILMVPVS